MRQKTTLNKQLVWSVRLLVFLVFILFLWSLGRNLMGLSQLDERLITAREEVVILRQKNQQLQEQAKESDSAFHEEQEIRNKLGVVRPDETVVLIPEEIWGELSSHSAEIAPEIEPPPLPIWKQWLYLFI